MDAIDLAMALLRDEASVALLTGDYLRGLLEQDLPAALVVVGKYNRVRHDQSYSQAKAKR